MKRVVALAAITGFLATAGVLMLTRSEADAISWDPQLVLDEQPDVPEAAEAHRAIEVSLNDASPSVRKGDTYRFQVRLSNPTSDDIMLTPCPSYSMGVDDGDAGYVTYALLPCDRAPAIPAGGHADFEMEIEPFPADCCSVTWKLWSPRFNPPLGWASAPTCDHENSESQSCSGP